MTGLVVKVDVAVLTIPELPAKTHRPGTLGLLASSSSAPALAASLGSGCLVGAVAGPMPRLIAMITSAAKGLDLSFSLDINSLVTLVAMKMDENA